MSFYVQHPYHLVDESPWPILSSVSSLVLVLGLVKAFCISSWTLTFVGLMLIMLIMFQWWSDVSSEGAFLGLHTNIVELGLRWGMLLFIVSEVCFFFSFFWAFFHSSLSPSVELGSCWPPIGILALDPFQVPLTNTIILLSSGATVTLCHHYLVNGVMNKSLVSLLLTVVLGLIFTAYQGLEYYESSFSMADSIYGSTFFIATGFHGFHVIVGSLFLLVCWFRLISGHFSQKHHFGFEAAAWYWHFVDVVWLFLYITIYWWGSV